MFRLMKYIAVYCDTIEAICIYRQLYTLYHYNSTNNTADITNYRTKLTQYFLKYVVYIVDYKHASLVSWIAADFSAV